MTSIVLTPEEREENDRKDRRQQEQASDSIGERGCTCNTNGRGTSGCALRRHTGW